MNNLWYPFTAMQDWAKGPQLSIESAQGSFLVASDGQRYLDGVASLWTNVHGHNHPLLNKAITDQVHKVSHSTLLGLSSPLAETLATQLIQVAPAGLEHVFYSDSGSTAVEIALKQAFQYWQIIERPEKRQFIHLEQAYHGDTLGAVAVGGIDIFHHVFGPLLIDTHRIPCPNAHYAGTETTSQEQSEAHSLQHLQTLLESHAKTVAALIIEPLVQGAGGILTHSPDYLRSVSSLCREHDVLLIVDEVATGFGRTGKLFACEHAGITPDLMCLAKGITGGYLPLAATLSTNRIYEAFLAPRKDGKTFFHGHTYTGNALACAAALANLEIFEAEQTIEGLPAKITRLTSKLEGLRSHPPVADIRQQGLMVGIELMAHPQTRRPFPADAFMGHQVCMEARTHGVIIRNLSDVIVLMPPLSISLDEIDLLVHALTRSLEVTQGLSKTTQGLSTTRS